MKLLVLQESVDDRKICIDRICKILVPKEYTRLDEIIEIVFFTTKEVQKEESSEDEIFEEELDNQQGDQKQDKKFDPAAFHQACINRFSNLENLIFLKRFAQLIALLIIKLPWFVQFPRFIRE
ncbi:MAG: hypothetical protein ACUVQO_06640 [Leptodesmis sp.]